MRDTRSIGWRRGSSCSSVSMANSTSILMSDTISTLDHSCAFFKMSRSLPAQLCCDLKRRDSCVNCDGKCGGGWEIDPRAETGVRLSMACIFHMVQPMTSLQYINLFIISTTSETEF